MALGEWTSSQVNQLADTAGVRVRSVRRWLAGGKCDDIDRFMGAVRTTAENLGIGNVTCDDRTQIDAALVRLIESRDPSVTLAAYQSPHARVVASHRIDPHVLSIDVDPAMIVEDAMRDAARGYYTMAFRKLCDEVEWQLRASPTTAIQILPACLYIGHRYVDETAFVSFAGTLAANLHNWTSRLRPDREAVALCLGQLACALNEHGNPDTASKLFQLDDVQRVLDPQRDVSYFQPSIIRNYCQNLSLREGSSKDVLTMLARTNDRWRTVGNHRAVATQQVIALAAGGKLNTLFDPIQQFYRDSAITINSMRLRRADARADLYHVFTGLYYGAIGRSLSGERYRDDELRHECDLMKWCIERLGRLQVECAAFLRPAVKHLVPAPLQVITGYCRFMPYSKEHVAVLNTLVSAVARLR